MFPRSYLLFIRSRGVVCTHRKKDVDKPGDGTMPSGSGIVEEEDPVWNEYNDETRDELLERSVNLLN